MQFRVEIPSRNIVVVPSEIYARFQEAMESLAATAEYYHWELPDRDVRIAEGVAHPLLVTGLMALAQGHDLVPIIEKIESLA